MRYNAIKKAIAYVLTFVMLMSYMPQTIFAATPSDFADFPTGWSAEAVTAAVKNGLLNGRSADKLEPEGFLTRAEMATIINRAFGATIEKDISHITDVKGGDWYYSEIAKAYNMQTFEGYEDGTMRPNNFITREEVFAVIARALVLESGDYSPLGEFNDAAYVSDWAKPYTSILVAKNYVNGDDLGNLNPQNNITREEFAQMMHNIVKTYYTQSGTYKSAGADCTLIRTGNVILSDVVIDGDLILGDGVGRGDITLTNVTIKGRLLARGGEGNVTLTNTTVGEGVVVKDVNGIVHFNNYRDEEPFVGIREITPATFIPKQVVIPPTGGGSGGGGGGSSSPSKVEYTIYHYIEDADGNINLNGLRYKEHKKKSGEVNKGSSIEIKSETIPGYELDTAAGDASKVDTSVKINSKTSFKLYYNLKKYNVNVVLPDGTSQSLVYKHGETFGTNFNMEAYPDVMFYYVSVDGETQVEVTPNLTITSELNILSKQIHTVKFDYNDSTGRVQEVRVFNNESVGTKIPVPQREGYELAGWNTKSDGSGSVFNDVIPVTSSATVYALWNPVKYSITYNSQFGFVSSVVTEYNIETAVTLPTEADFEPHDGFAFDGWYKEDNFKTKVNSIEAGTTGNIVLYARWLDVSVTYYDVTFNLNYAGAPSPSTVKVAEGETAQQPSDPVRTGYTFGGWYTSAECITAYDFSATVNANTDIYAKWTVDTYTITYNTNGGTFKAGAYKPEAFTIENLPLALPTADDIAYIGYDFKGWYSDAGFTMPVSQIAAGTLSNVTLYAKWQAKTYNVVIKTPGAPDQTKVFVHGQTIGNVIPNDPVRTGYKFTGYNTAADGSGTSYSKTEAITESLTLYTQWTLVNYNINYELGGAAISNAGAFDKDYTIEETVTLPVASDFAPRPGYTFEGWYTSSDFSGSAVTQIASGSVNDVTFYAKWNEVKYSIAYNTNGGVIKNTDKFISEYTVTQSVKLPVASDFEARAGYTFDGWYDNEALTGSKITSIPANSTGNKTLWAKWSKQSYSVSYDLNGGSKKNPAAFVTSFTVSDSITLPTAVDVEKDGYDFKGWFTSSSFTGSAVTTIPAGTTESVKLYAKWEKKTYTVKFNVDGKVTEKTYTHGDKISTQMSDPSKNGYTFAGWYTGQNGTGTAYTKDSEVKGAYILYAYWSTVSYPVAYELNGGSKKTGVTFKESYTVEESFALPAKDDMVAPEGYNFKGWYRNSELTDGPVTSVSAGTTGSLNFWAKWEKNTYTVTFVTDGTSVNKSYTHGDKISSKMPDPAKMGYTFAGWYTEPNGEGTKYTKDSAVTSAKTLYAYWTINKYTITYELNGGTKKNEAAFKTSYTIHDAFALPVMADFNEYEGYEFKGWYKNADFTGGQVTNVASGSTGSFTLYAKWEKKTYTVSFVTDGATSTKTYTHGDKISTQMSEPAKTGYTFAGWYTEPNGAGTKYTGDSAVTDSYTLYAYWTLVSYEVKYELNGGTTAPGYTLKTSYNIEEGFALPASGDLVAVEGYEFKGWYKNADFSGGQVTSVPAGTSGNLTFWAKWSKTTHTVTFNVNGQTSTKTYTYGDKISTQMADPSKTAYTFAGWNTAEDGSGTAYSGDSEIKSDLTLYAQWTVVNYTITYKLGGGEALNPSAFVSSYNIESTVTLPSASDFKPREGLTFVGWYKDSAYVTGPVTEIPLGSSGNVEFYARWEENTYTVTFDVDGVVTGKTYVHGEKISDHMTEPSKDGFEFTGWNTAPDGTGTNYQSSDKVTSANTLYAQFNAIRYTITYVLGDGYSFKAGYTPVSEFYVTSDDIALPASSDINESATHEFYGWYLDSAYTQAVSKIDKGTTGNITVYAKWNEKIKVYHDVVFGYNYADAPQNGVYSKIAVEEGNKIGSQKPADPSRNGYSFGGWYADMACTSEFNFDKAITAVTTIYAKWNKETYSIDYDLGGASKGNDAAFVTSYDVETAVTLPLEGDFAPRAGYKFNGWYDNAEFSGSIVTSIPAGTVGDKKFYAQWEKEVYTISYETNGAVIKNTDAFKASYTVTDSITLPSLSDFEERESYTFIGWYDNAAFTGEAITSIPAGGTGNKVFYAKWEKKVYDITFVVDGVENTVSYEHGELLSAKVSDPSKQGYTFKEWNTSSTGVGIAYSANTAIKQPATLYATWNTVSYDISYVLNEGVIKNSSAFVSTYNIETAVTLPVAADFEENEAYEFKGWYTDSGFTSAQVSSVTLGSTGNKTFYAKWEKKTYDVSFVVDGTETTLTYTHGETVGSKMTSPSKEGYNFGGWNISSDGSGDAYTAGTQVTKSVKLYAIWNAVNYTITYNLNGAGQGNASAFIASYDIETSVALPVEADFSGMEAYTFLGWYDNNSFAGEAVTSIPAGSTGNKEYWAKWEIKTYDVVFSVDGSTVSKTYSHGDTIASQMAEPSKSGYNFAGWNTDENGLGFSYNSASAVTSAQTLYAQWSVIDYTITYNLNDGVMGNASAFVASYNVEQTVALPSETDFVAREDYTFLGWYDNSAMAGEAVTSIPLGSTGNKEYWAKWEKKTYNVTFNIDGTVSSVNYEHGETIASKVTAPSKTGYTFAGWNTSADGMGDAYTQTTAVKKELNLYAQWNVVDYSISYNLGGATQGSTTAFVASYNIEKSVTLPTEADFAGMEAYTFIGWYDNSAMTGDPVTNIPLGSTGNKEYWAKWEIKTLNVTFNVDGSATQRTYNYGDTIGSKITEPSKTGYTFAGWNTSESGLGFWYSSSSSVQSALTLYAQWDAVDYSITYKLEGGTQQNTDAFVSSYNIETSVTLPVSADFAEREGYTFIGWYENSSFTGEAVTSIPAGVTGNKEYWARWEKNSYTVTFNVDGTVTSSAYVHGEKISDHVTEPSKEGYEFIGWNTNEDGSGTSYQGSDEVTSGLTLYAQFKELDYSITYVRGKIPGTNTPFEFKDGYTPVYEYRVTSEDIVLPVASDFKEYEDYEFYGWYTDVNYTRKITVIEKGSTGNVKVYAKWNEKEKVYYDVVFNYNYIGAPQNGEYSKISVEAGKLIAGQKPVDPSRKGYEFDGWYKDAACTQGFSFVEAISTHTTIYAKWTVNEYSVTYITSGGVIGNESAFTNKYTVDTEVTLPVSADFAQRPGYEFVGWYDNAEFSGSQVTSIPAGSTGDKTFYAKWNKLTYTITYEKGVGTVANASAFVSDYSVTDAVTLPVASDFVAVEGYTFAGWYDNAEFTGDPVTSVGANTVGNLTFWAKWNKNEYVVTFSVDGDETSYTYTHGELLSSKVSTPSKQGYSFVEWNTEADSTGIIYTDNTEIKQSITLYAIWSANTYKVEYNAPDSTGTTAVYTSTHEYGVSKALTPNKYTKEGYTFSSWKLEGEDVYYTDGQEVLNLTDVNNAVIKLTAMWTANNYTVKYNGNGATDGTMADSDYVYDEEYTLSQNAYTRVGYSFLGWAENASATTAKYTDMHTVKNLTSQANGEVVLYAVWSESTYTVKYNGNGATNGTMSDSVYAYSESKALDANSYVKVGYNFLGWSTDAAATVPQYTNGQSVSGLTADGGVVTLYAVWQVETYKLVFDVNGGIAFTESDLPAGYVLEDGKATVTVSYGSSYPELPEAKHSDNKLLFGGWYIGSELISAGQTVGDLTDTTVTAKWSNKLIHTVVFENYNSDGTAKHESVINGEMISVPETPVKTGYSFGGWYADSSFTTEFDFGKVIDSATTQTITVYVKWNINTYTVSFDADNGTEVQTITVNYGDVLTKPADPVKAGSTFNGWYADGVLYNFALPVTSGLTLVAKWDTNTYTVSIDADNGTEVQTLTVNHGDVLTKPADPVKTGYSFGGWYADNAEYDFTLPVTSGLTIVAKWNINTYTVSFDADNGTEVQTITVNHGDVLTKPADPVKEGFIFAGWYADGALYDFTKPVTSNLTLVAKWDINTYIVILDADNGSGVQTFTLNHGEKVTKPADPAKTGYSFAGWYAGSVLYDFTLPVTSDLTIVAKWDINTYKVCIDADNGTEVQTLTVNHGDILTKPADPEKEGYIFAGWYVNGALYDFTKPVTTAITIIAKWDEKPAESYTITYVLNGGEKLDEAAFVSSYTSADEVMLPTASSFKERDDGNAFAGWYDNEALTGEPVTSIPAGSSGAKTFWAKWNQSFVVTFYEGAIEDDSMYINEKKVAAGTTMAQSDIDDAMSVILPYDYPEKGYRDGEYTHLIYPDLWYVADDGEWKPFDDTVVINGNMNVYYSFKSVSLFFDFELGDYKLSQPVSVSVPYSRDTRIMDSVKDALYMVRNQIDIALSIDDVYLKSIAKSAEELEEIIDADGNFKYVNVNTAISNIIDSKEIDGEIAEYIKEIIVSNNDDEKLNSAILMVGDSELIKDGLLGGGEYDFATVKSYIDGLSVEERESFADEVHNILASKQFYIDFIDGFEKDHDTFKVSHENINFVMAVANAVSEYTYEELKDRIYAKFGKVIDVLGDDVAKEFMVDSQIRYHNGAQELWNEFMANKDDADYSTTYPSYLTFRLNAIDHLFRPIYENSREKTILRLTEANVYHFADNVYMQQLVNKDTDTLINELFYKVPKTEENIGYALWPSEEGESGLLHYYDYMYERVLLLDKAMLWYRDNLPADEFATLQTEIYKYGSEALNKSNEYVDAYEADGSLPLDKNIKDLMEIEAFAKVMNREGEKIANGLQKYKATQFYGTTWDAESLRNVEYARSIVETALGVDNPVFNADTLLDRGELNAAINRVGFTEFEDSFDQDMGYTVTVHAIERVFKDNHIKVRRFHW